MSQTRTSRLPVILVPCHQQKCLLPVVMAFTLCRSTTYFYYITNRTKKKSPGLKRSHTTSPQSSILNLPSEKCSTYSLKHFLCQTWNEQLKLLRLLYDKQSNCYIAKRPYLLRVAPYVNGLEWLSVNTIAETKAQHVSWITALKNYKMTRRD